MRVLVCGGRAFANTPLLESTLDTLFARRPFVVLIHGGARGADTMAGEWAAARGIAVEVYEADWEGLGTPGGPIRNQRMLDEGLPDLVIAFPGGRGTADMARRARQAGIEVREVAASS